MVLQKGQIREFPLREDATIFQISEFNVCSMSGERPNIVVLLSDQQTVSCYGSPIYPGLTPNLDKMARRGLLFERAFTPQPVCGPTRACLQTGRWATETGCFRNGIALPPGTPTIASLLRKAGYEVGYIGKWHLASTPRERS